MSPNEPQPTPFSETLPTALPYLPPLARPIGEPVPSAGNPIMVEQTAVASHQPHQTQTTTRPSAARITIAVFTLGLSIPFIGIRRRPTTRDHK